MTSFAEQVQSIVGPLMNGLGFVLDGASNFDEGGREGSIVFYRSHDCKIQIFKSSREGSVNCLIGPLNATNEYGIIRPESEWQFIDAFTPEPDIPLEELVKAISYDAKPTASQLEEVRDRIAQYYEDAHAGILKMYGNA